MQMQKGSSWGCTRLGGGGVTTDRRVDSGQKGWDDDDREKLWAVQLYMIHLAQSSIARNITLVIYIACPKTPTDIRQQRSWRREGVNPRAWHLINIGNCGRFTYIQVPWLIFKGKVLDHEKVSAIQSK